MSGEQTTWSLAEHIARRQGAAPPITVAQAIEQTTLAFGEPGMCSVCGAPGLVDVADETRRTTWVTCTRCLHHWSHCEASADEPPGRD